MRCRQKTSICKRLEVKGINLFINILTEVTNECSDTEPVMFILQGNRLYLELETLGPFFYASEFHIGGGLVLLSGVLFIQLFPITGIVFLNH